MKILKYTIIGLAIVVIGFFLFGIIKPEISYDCEIMIEKSLSESWAVSQDDEKMKDWLDGFQKLEHVSGTPGTVGAVSDVYFITNGETMTIRETITNIVPNESISMDFDSDFMNMKYEISMNTVDGKTKINSTTSVIGNGMFSKSIIALMSGSFKAEEEKNLSRLKQTIENNTKDYSND